MDKLISYLIILILFFSFVSSSILGVSPDKLVFNENQNEKICMNFSLLGDSGSIFYGAIKWSEEKSRDISKYTLSSEQVNVYPDFPKQIPAGRYQICISSEDSKNKYGILSYKLENSSYAIGIWVEVNATKNNFNPILSLTGNAVKENSFGKLFIFSPLLFLIVLVFLLIRLKKKT
jgi:hypothetical protein